MNVEHVKLFTNIVNLLKLIIVRPISSVSCERGFSTLRRVKTCLRNNMTSSRLHSVIIPNIHAKEFDNINTDAIINEFILKNNWRRSKFSM